MRTIVIIAAVLAAFALSACGSGSAEDACSSPAEGTSVEMADFSYTPACLAVDAGASIDLRNSGEAPHTFTVSDSEIDVEVAAGATDTVGLGGLTAGTYEVTCTLHPQMTGAIQVR